MLFRCSLPNCPAFAFSKHEPRGWTGHVEARYVIQILGEGVGERVIQVRRAAPRDRDLCRVEACIRIAFHQSCRT